LANELKLVTRGTAERDANESGDLTFSREPALDAHRQLCAAPLLWPLELRLRENPLRRRLDQCQRSHALRVVESEIESNEAAKRVADDIDGRVTHELVHRGEHRASLRADAIASFDDLPGHSRLGSQVLQPNHTPARRQPFNERGHSRPAGEHGAENDDRLPSPFISRSHGALG
jgi:hypothetical protein